jgi:NADPH:quinone reductase-like Zn-dependent oxidoreductase
MHINVMNLVNSNHENASIYMCQILVTPSNLTGVETMKAATYQKYGSADVVEIKEIPRPTINDNQVLVKVYATSVTTADWRLRASAFPVYAWLPGRIMFGLFAPKSKVLGMDFSGRIVSVGADVSQFKLGDEVFGFAKNGAHAEYLAISENEAIVKKPDRLGYDEAAAVPFGALSALVFLRDFAKIKRGQRVLINGASGGVGVFAVQLAKHFGATVTGVCSTANLALVNSIGADHVIDYTAEDFASTGETYDVILDTVGTTSFSRSKRALTDSGLYVPLEFDLGEIFQSLVLSMFRAKKVVIGISGDTQDDLIFISDLLERGEIRPIIDEHYSLERIADAHRRVESRHKTGSVIVNVEQSNSIRLAAA